MRNNNQSFIIIQYKRQHCTLSWQTGYYVYEPQFPYHFDDRQKSYYYYYYLRLTEKRMDNFTTCNNRACPNIIFGKMLASYKK